MKIYPFAIASAAVLGTAALLVGSGTAATETGTTASQQLLINQRISQAAVKRSNSSLNYLAPIRTTTSDAANTGANGVTPLSKVPGAGQGWTTAQIANQAITTAKIANQAVTPTQLSNPSWFVHVTSTGTVQASTKGLTVTAAVSGAQSSIYTLTFPTNVSACVPIVTPQSFANAADVAIANATPGAQNTQWVVSTFWNNSGNSLQPGAVSFYMTLQC